MAKRLVLCAVFAWFLIGGIAHFVFTDIEMKIVPPSLPEPRLLVWITGVAELVGAIALLWHRTRASAGWLLIVLTIAVTPANIYMLTHAALFPAVPFWALVARLPLQGLLLAGIWWSTRPERRENTA